MGEITYWGLQSKLARCIGLTRSTVSEIFAGKRRATLAQAAKLEAEFVKRNIPLNRGDLLYGIRVDKSNPQSIETYLKERNSGNTAGEEK